MSVAAFANNLHRIADSLRNTAGLLRDSGDVIAREVKANIDYGRNAGDFRVDDTGTVPGSAFTELSDYTLRQRERAGNSSRQPLKDTGDMYRSIGTRAGTALKIVVGPKTSRQRAKMVKQLGRGISTDRQQPIPPRNPLGYNRHARDLVLNRWRTALGVNNRSSVKIEIRL